MNEDVINSDMSGIECKQEEIFQEKKLLLGTNFEEYMNGFELLKGVNFGGGNELKKSPSSVSSSSKDCETINATNCLEERKAMSVSEETITTMRECLLQTGFEDDKENSEDWLGEFENDDFWGQGKETKNAFDLEVVDLFQIDKM